MSREERPEVSPDHVTERLGTVAQQLEPVAEVGTEVAPEVEAPAPSRVDDVARAAIERAERDKAPAERKGRRGGREVTEETREFWETWAEEKSTREPATEAAREPARETGEATHEPAPAAEVTEAGGERRPRSRGGERGERGRDRGRDKERGGRDKAAVKPEAGDGQAERGPRTKRDTSASPPPVTAEGAQTRLFISLGKKHGVTADDLRALLAGPIGGDKERIGSVSLRDSHAHVRVPEELVEKIIAGVHGTQHNEHDVTVERARA
jgi:hypothetical protein